MLLKCVLELFRSCRGMSLLYLKYCRHQENKILPECTSIIRIVSKLCNGCIQVITDSLRPYFQKRRAEATIIIKSVIVLMCRSLVLGQYEANLYYLIFD